MADQPVHILLHTDPGGGYTIWAIYAHYQVAIAHIPGHVGLELVRKVARVFAVSYGMIEVKED